MGSRRKPKSDIAGPRIFNVAPSELDLFTRSLLLMLAESQRSMIAARIATLRREDTLKQNRSDASIEATKQPEAAAMLNVSRSNVQRDRKAVGHGASRLRQAVERNEIAFSEAADSGSRRH